MAQYTIGDKAHRLLTAAATVNATLVVAAPGEVYRAFGYNAAGAARYLKFYDKASAPVVGTDTPVITIYLPANSTFSFEWRFPFRFGIGYAFTTAAADADTGALTSGDILCFNLLHSGGTP